MAITFNEAFFTALGHSAPIRALVVGKAQEIAARARSSAPVDTGAYRDSIHVEVIETPYRTVARVVADSDDALLVESRTGNLARAAGGATRGR
jgi:hypothetical protein